MKTYPISEARVELSMLVERALAGAPQRVTRYGNEAAVILSEEAWPARPRAAATLGALLARFGRGGAAGEDMTNRP